MHKAFSHSAAGVCSPKPQGPSWADSTAPFYRRGNQGSVDCCLADSPTVRSGGAWSRIQSSELFPAVQGPSVPRTEKESWRGHLCHTALAQAGWLVEGQGWGQRPGAQKRCLATTGMAQWGACPTPAAGANSPPGGSGSYLGTHPSLAMFTQQCEYT